MAGDSSLPRRLTVQLVVPEDSTFLEVVEALWIQLGKSSVSCCQAWGPGRFQITFSNDAWLSKVKEHGILFRDLRVHVESLDDATLWMTIRNAPFEMSRETVAAALLPFGTLLAHEFEIPKDCDPVTNGNRRVKFRMRQPVPNFLKVGRYTLMCTYNGVVRLCRRCGAAGHMVANCSAAFCTCCRQVGHDSGRCPDRLDLSVFLGADTPARAMDQALVRTSETTGALLSAEDFPALAQEESQRAPVLLSSPRVQEGAASSSLGSVRSLHIVTDDELDGIDWTSALSDDAEPHMDSGGTVGLLRGRPISQPVQQAQKRRKVVARSSAASAGSPGSVRVPRDTGVGPPAGDQRLYSASDGPG